MKYCGKHHQNSWINANEILGNTPVKHWGKPPKRYREKCQWNSVGKTSKILVFVANKEPKKTLLS